jgi:hypothetical protein
MSIPKFIDAGQPAGIRSETETFLLGIVGAGGSSSKSIAVGDWVAVDTSFTGSDRVLYVIEAAGVATVGNPAVIGVALEAVEVDEPATVGVVASVKVRVCTSGYCASASVAGAAVAGSALVGPIGTAGQAAIEVPGTTSGKLCGVALAADTANYAPVLVLKNF